MYLFSCTFLEYLLLFLNDNVDEKGEWFSNSKNSASGCCLAFAWFLPGVAYKSVAYRKEACKSQQGSLCRSFSGCNHAHLIISENMHVISSWVTWFFFSSSFEVLKAISIQVFQAIDRIFQFFVMDNFYSFGFDLNFLFDLF